MVTDANRLFDWLHRRTRTIKLKREVNEKTLIIETVGGTITVHPYNSDINTGYPVIIVDVEANGQSWVQTTKDSATIAKTAKVYIVAPYGRDAEG
jgi:hypothetical protein